MWVLMLFAQSIPYMMLSPSARSIALGESNVAQVREVEELFLNPAVLAGVSNFTTGAGYIDWFMDIGYGSATFAWRPKNSNNVFGLTFSMMNYGEFEKYNIDGELLGTFTSQATIFTFSFARAVGEDVFGGFNYKWIIDRIEEDTKTGWLVDAGLTFHTPYKVWQRAPFLPLSNAIVFQNVGPGIDVSPPSALLLGFSWATFALKVKKKHIVPPYSFLTLGLKFPFYGEGAEVRAGFELNVGNIVFFRIGVLRRLKDIAVVDGKSASYDINLTHMGFGFGINFRDVRVDYAARTDYIELTHHLSLSISF